MSGLSRFGELLLWVFFVYGVKTVSCQDKVGGFVGDSVLLSCIYSNPLPASVSVFWTDKDDSIVLDIVKGQTDFSTQNQKFKGRVFSFPTEYKKGNFSIRVEKLQLSDSGPYECLIPKKDFQQRLTLNVSERRVDSAATTPPPGPSGGGAAVTPNSVHMILLPLLLSLLLTSLD